MTIVETIVSDSPAVVAGGALFDSGALFAPF